MTFEPDVARALSFGSAAEAYERFRPGYPAELLSTLLDRATGELRRAIEVGAGTGKATRLLAGAGIDVTAVEPDRAMLDVLERECAGLPVSPLCTTFEEAGSANGPFDLLYAAAAWHWTEPEGRYDRVAALVRPGGLVGFFGGAMELADPALAAAEQAIVARLGQGRPPGPITVGDGVDWPGDELAADPRFTDVRQQLIPRRFEVGREQFLGYLDTVSAYRVLSDGDRRTAFTELAELLPEQVAVTADIVVHTARLSTVTTRTA